MGAQASRIYVGGLDTRITERDLEDEVSLSTTASLQGLHAAARDCHGTPQHDGPRQHAACLGQEVLAHPTCSSAATGR